MSTIGNTLFSQIEINGQLVDISTLDSNDGLYQLPVGQTSAHVVFTMKDNTSLPRGVFEENTYITGVTLPDAMHNIASYSFHGVTNINTNDRNAILAINPYAFDAEPTPPGPEPKTDPDLHYEGGTGDYDLYTHIETIPGLVNSYNVSPISYVSSDTTVATVNSDGTINYLAVGNTSISASFSGDSTYEADTTTFTLTIHDSTPTYTLSWKQDPITITESTSISGYVEYTGKGTLNYSSSNPNFSIDSNGFVYAPSGGVDDTTNITVSDGTLSATVVVNYQTKQTATGQWYKDGNPVNDLVLVQGGSGTQTLTFSATPSDSWTFMDPMWSGISVNTTTGEITITESDLITGTLLISATRYEDSSYQYGSANLNIRVLPSGTDPKFFYEQDSVSLDNQSMTTSTPMLHDEYMGLGYTKTYTSADTNVATVDENGMISFVGAGNTTVTATTTNGTDTYTATIAVNCSVMKQYPSASFEYNGSPYYGGTLPVVTPFSGSIYLTNMTPSEGWVITDPMIQGITVSGYEINVKDLSQGTYYINANYPEDSDYYSGMTSLTLRVLPSGTNPNFFYEQESVGLDNQAMSQSTPMLYNNTGFTAMPTYQSADTTIATVDENGMISFVGAGNTTVTASITNGTDTYTTSITVNCNVMNA